MGASTCCLDGRRALSQAHGDQFGTAERLRRIRSCVVQRLRKHAPFANSRRMMREHMRRSERVRRHTSRPVGRVKPQPRLGFARSSTILFGRPRLARYSHFAAPSCSRRRHPSPSDEQKPDRLGGRDVADQIARSSLRALVSGAPFEPSKLFLCFRREMLPSYRTTGEHGLDPSRRRRGWRGGKLARPRIAHLSGSARIDIRMWIDRYGATFARRFAMTFVRILLADRAIAHA